MKPTPASDTSIMSTLTLRAPRASNSASVRAPAPPSSRAGRRNRTRRGTWATPVTTRSSSSAEPRPAAPSVTRVPGEEPSAARMRSGMRPSIAISTARGWTTLAPEWASSATSRYATRFSSTASGTRRGSAVNTPGTSLKMSMRSTPRATPSTAAVVSLPPRPRVVTWPSSVTPWNPATTATRPFRKWASTGSGSARSTRALPKLSSVMMPASRPVSAAAGTPSARRVWASTTQAMISPQAASRSRSRGSASAPPSSPSKPSSVSVAYGSPARPMADTTATTCSPSASASRMRAVTFRRAAGVTTDVPPNFCTTMRTAPPPAGLFPRWSSPRPAALRQQLRDLKRVQRGAFANLIAHDPQVQSALDGRIFPDAAHEYLVLARRVQRHRIALRLGLVHHGDARRRGQKLPRPLGRQGRAGLHVDAFRVAAQHRHPHRRRADADRVVVPHFAGFPHHFPLFFGVAVVVEDVHLRDDVEQNRVMPGLPGHGQPPGRQGLSGLIVLHLPQQLLHGRRARPRHRLVRRHDDALDAGLPVQRVQGHQHNDGGAVRVGNDTVVTQRGVRVDLRHHQRHVRIQAEGAGVVDDDRAGLHRRPHPLPADRAAGAEKGHVDAPEGLLGHGLHDHVSFAVADGFAGAARRGQKPQFSRGKVPLAQKLQQFGADGSRRAQDRDVEQFHVASSNAGRGRRGPVTARAADFAGSAWAGAAVPPAPRPPCPR